MPLYVGCIETSKKRFLQGKIQVEADDFHDARRKLGEIVKNQKQTVEDALLCVNVITEPYRVGEITEVKDGS